MKQFASIVLWVCIVAVFSIESEAYGNKQCHPNFETCTAACASACNGKSFKCKIDVGNCNDQVAVLIKTCSDPFYSSSCSNVCEKVRVVLGLQDLLFAATPAPAILNIPGSFYSIYY
jgi:hypothetical protein